MQHCDSNVGGSVDIYLIRDSFCQKLSKYLFACVNRFRLRQHYDSTTTARVAIPKVGVYSPEKCAVSHIVFARYQ